MDEDRTQDPSKQRRQHARERGQVAHSPELTAAAGLLGATFALGWRGEALVAALLELVRRPLLTPPALSADADGVVGHLRGLAFDIGGPLLLILVAFAVAALAAHLVQVQGLWAPGLLAPDVTRLWAPGQMGAAPARAGRGLWSLARGLIVAAVAAWVLRSAWPRLTALGGLDTPGLALASAQVLRDLTLTLAAATLALGAIDYFVQHRRFEASLRLTPEQHREDLRSAEGDPGLRARRRRLALSWRDGPAELLKGCSLVLTAPGGLTVVLAGGPLPRPVTVRAIQSAAKGEALRRDAEAAGIPAVDAPTLARRLALRRTPNLPADPDLLGTLDRLWPVAVSHSR